MDLEKAKKLALYHANTGTSAEVANQMPAVRMVIKNLEDSLKEIQRLRAELAKAGNENLRLRNRIAGRNRVSDVLAENGELIAANATIRQLNQHIEALQAELEEYRRGDNWLRLANDSLADQLEALKAAQAWQPIETAPKDGTLFLVWCPSAHGLPAMFSLCAWHEDAGFCVDELRYPTVWMPLPPTDSAKPVEGE